MRALPNNGRNEYWEIPLKVRKQSHPLKPNPSKLPPEVFITNTPPPPPPLPLAADVYPRLTEPVKRKAKRKARKAPTPMEGDIPQLTFDQEATHVPMNWVA
jgi:hypothetical protein